jgi:ketosteroid isomerase-like protein
MLNKKVLSVATGALLIVGIIAGLAQTADKADEQALRDIIQQQDEGKDVMKYTDNAIFVSGALPRPIIGREVGLRTKEEIAKSTPNRTTKREVERLVVSKSADMAYEYGNFTTTHDGPDKKRTGFNGSYLRVWRKLDGQWKVDVSFNRKNES